MQAHDVVFDFNISSYSSLMAFIANNNQIYIWDNISNQIFTELSYNGQRWKDISINADGKIIAGQSESGDLHIWQEIEKGSYRYFQTIDTEKTISAIALDHSGEYLAVGEDTSAISIDIWDIKNEFFLKQNLRYVHTESNNLFSLESLDFHPTHSDTLVSLSCQAIIASQLSNCQILLWDTDRSEPFLPALIERLTYIPFHQDRNLGRKSNGLISFSPDGSQLWYKDPYPILSELNLYEEPTLFNAPISTFELSSNGKWLLAKR